MLKKIFLAGLVLVLVISCFFLFKSKNRDDAPSINVYSWGEFISNGADGTLDVNKEFTKKTGVKVNYKTFQNNEELFAKLLGGGADYDVIIPSDYMVSRLIENDMLAKIDFNNIPNYKFIDDRFKNLDFDDKNEYSVPYMWGVVGIFYNKLEVKEEEKNISWDILWDKEYSGRILMFDNARDTFAISLLRLGYSINSEDKSHWREAADELVKQKPLVQAYVMDQIFDKMGNGEAALAPYYSGDAAVMVKNNPNVGFVIPSGSTNRFVDSMCVPKNSRNKDLAEKYIDFMCQTDIAIANVNQTGYSTPHKEAYNKLSEDVKNNHVFYPDEQILKNSQVFVNLPEDINKSLDELWIEVKSGGISQKPWVLIVILSGFIILYVCIVLYKKRKK